MLKREDFGKMEIWQGGQEALYSKDGREITLFPIKGKIPCACGDDCPDLACTDAEIG